MKEQIEEMAKLACTGFDGNCKGCPFDFYPPCPPKASAKRLYNAGYRKQKEGEWIYRENEFGNAYYACSICDCQTRYKENYCSNCGAHMKGGDKE